MTIYSYVATRSHTEDVIIFDENFNPNLFRLEFFEDEDSETSGYGSMEFNVATHTATLYYYDHPETLAPSVHHYDLHDFDLERGDGVLSATYLGDLYRAAERFLCKVLTYRAEEAERLMREYLEELERA